MNGKETGPEARGEKLQQWGEEIDELKAETVRTNTEPRSRQRRDKLGDLRKKMDVAREHLIRVFQSMKGDDSPQ